MAFNNAHSFSVGAANINIYQNHQTPSPAAILRRAQAVEALHTSATVGYISKCHPGTREKVTADIVDWVVGAASADHGSPPHKSILWFSGPAGGGKTSIMRGIVDRCAARQFSTLSFFFSVRGSGVTSVRPFVATIAHQLVALDPILKPIVYDVIQDRPTVFEESLEFQMERLLVEPLQSPAFRLRPSPWKIAIAIDGLDECREEREREQLIDFIYSLITKLPSLIVVIIASRPEFDLRRAFARPKVNEITGHIKLHDYNGSDDIRAFVCDELEEIRQSHPLAALIPEGWLFEETVQLLVDKSSGNFIIPTIAMKYIKHSRRNPVDSLRIIVGLLKNPSPSSKPFAELDSLYAHILHPPDTDLSLIRRILHITIALTKLGEEVYLVPSFFDDFLELSRGTTTTTLCDLHSILHTPESGYKPIEFHHKSLTDYLLDHERSLDLFQSPYETELDIATCCATHLTCWGSHPIVNHSRYIFYSARLWQDHLYFYIDQKPVPAALPKVIADLDPRNAAMCFFLHGIDSHEFWDREPKRFHGAFCSRQHCVRLCQLMARVATCKDECEAFRKTFDRDDIKGRFNALSKFKSETGLFAPLDPNGRVVFDGEDEDGGDEGGGEEGGEEDVQPEAGPSTLPPSLDINLEAGTAGRLVGGSGGSAMALSMERHDSRTVSKKRPHDGVEANPKRKRKTGNGD